MKKYWREPDKFKIIYAPHHSFTDGMHFATFLENGKFILELAKKYKNKTTWLFKPHPKLEYALIKENLMTEDEVRQYYKEWEKLVQNMNLEIILIFSNLQI